MEISTLVSLLDQPHIAADALQSWRLTNVPRAQQVLLELAETGLTLDLLATICDQLAQHLPKQTDPDATLAAFSRYLFAVRSPLSLAALFDRDPSAMPMLLAALSLGSQWTDLLVEDPEAFDLLRQSSELPFTRETLISEAIGEIESLEDEPATVATLSRLRRRHLLRIAYADVVRQDPLATVLQELSNLGAALVEAALAASRRRNPPNGNGHSTPAAVTNSRCVVIAAGQLGGGEPSYALPLELLCVYEPPKGAGTAITSAAEYFDRVARLVRRLLSESGCHVQLLTLPESPTKHAAHTADDCVIGFDSFGRTWHRCEMLKARPIAGDHAFGDDLLHRVESWVFRRYLNRADETGIKALKRRILLSATIHQEDWRNVRLGRGGLADIENTTTLLQLLAGGDQPAVRRRSVFDALAGLEKAGTLTPLERSELADSYTFLRQVEHRIQLSVDLNSSVLPDEAQFVAQIANQCHAKSVNEFCQRLRQCLTKTWQTLERLLCSAFAEEPPTPREVELLLDPNPSAAEIRAALDPFGFQQAAEALAMLNDLASEQVAFLSTRRCRHLLATILPKLLSAVGRTPQPDRTLGDLVRVSSSLGGKGVLWDLFRFHPPSLDLYVRLCTASSYLADLLTTNPGMIDELIDSLQLDKLPTRSDLDATLAELCRGSSATLNVLRDFKNAEHLRIGVRDILGKDDIDRTHEALADVAETCLGHVVQIEFDRLVEKYGLPAIGPGPFEGEPSRLVILGLGKLGGREPNYHSPLDVLFLYEADGVTRQMGHSRRQERTANNHFFTQLAQRVIKQLAELTPKGRLYTVEMPLRPIGVGGALAMTFTEYVKHFQSSTAPLWQWQALCQARPVFGEPDAVEAIARLTQQLLVERPPQETDWSELRRTRQQLEVGASPHNLKRGPGGALDIEFVVQLLQLQRAATAPQVLTTSTQAAIATLGACGALSAETTATLGDAYRFLRRVESGVRLLDTAKRHDLPSDPADMERLALLLGHGNPDRLRQQCLNWMVATRAIFDQLTANV